MPDKPQVAVFDTAFHMTMPPKAYRYAIPTKYYEEDHLRRYGFHGTSHRFVSKRAIELMGKPASELKIIVCHLGNGSSLSAVADGKCQDTSMGLSPLAGLPMGTRAGDIDTCVAQFIMNKYNLSADQCLNMLNKESGVLALSNGLSSDFRDLEAGAKSGNEACQLALDKFCYETRKYIGAYAAALGGLDCLVFTAGVGENGPTNRASICQGLEFMGVKLDPERNQVRGEEALISADDSRVKGWVIPTNEELMIAQDTAALCGK
jgi:acetate kinase